MVHTFQCSGCSTELEVEGANQGKLVTCELCGEVQVVPERVMDPGETHRGFVIGQMIDSNIVWNSYQAHPDDNNDHLDEKSVYLKIPSVFLKDNLDEFDEFVNSVCRYSSLNVREFTPLLRRSGLRGNPFFVFKYEESLNLNEFVDAYAPLAPIDSLAIVRMVSAAMESIWEIEGETHQNLKPSLIRINTANEIRIEEFGISNFMLKHPEIMDRGLDIWNVRYMSPEFLAEGEADSPAVDIFSLGRIFHLLLTGEEIFAGETRIDVIPTLEPPSLLRSSRNIPAEVMRLYKAMVEPDPRSRIQSWTDLSARIDAIFESRQRKGLSKNYKTQRDLPRGPSIKSLQRGHNLKSVGTRVETPSDDTERLGGGGRRKSASKPHKTQARLLKRKELERQNLKRKWGRKKLEPERKSFSDVLKENVGLIAFSIIGLVVAGLIIGIAVTRKKDEPSASPLGKSAETETARKESPVAEPSTSGESGSASSPAAVDRTAAAAAGGRTPTLARRINQVEAFLGRDPSRVKEAIGRYQDLIEVALREKDLDKMQFIKERIVVLEELRRGQASKAFDQLRGSALELWGDGSRQEALALLRGYEGEFAKETKLDRLKLIRELERERELLAEREKRERLTEAEEKALIKELFDEMAADLVEGRIDDAAASVVGALEEVTSDRGREFLVSTLAQLNLYADLPEMLMDKYAAVKGGKINLSFLEPPAEEALVTDVHGGKVYFKTAPDGEERAFSWVELPLPLIAALIESTGPSLRDYHLLKGLIAVRKRFGAAAEKSFRRLPLGLESSFEPFTRALQTESEMKAILKPYGVKYLSGDNLGLVEQLNQTTLTRFQAGRLFDKLQSFVDKHGDFIKDRSNAVAIEALAQFCNQHMKTEKTLSSSITIAKPAASAPASTPGATTSTSEQLERALSTALNNRAGETAINLAPGRYSLPKKIFDLTDISIMGGPGVVFVNGLSLFGDDVTISGVDMQEGGLTVTTDSRRLTIRDCVFTQGVVRLEKCRKVTLANSVFRGLILADTTDVTIDHCVIASPRQGLARQGALWLDAKDVAIRDSVIFGDHYGVIFSDRENRRKKIFENCVWFGEKGLAALREDRREIDYKSAVDKPLRLRKYCRPRSNVYERPRFAAPARGDWRLVRRSPGQGAASDGGDCGVTIGANENE